MKPRSSNCRSESQYLSEPPFGINTDAVRALARCLARQAARESIETVSSPDISEIGQANTDLDPETDNE
jgi:hypothetical protein